jgi:ATP-binding cassette subfamily C protein
VYARERIAEGARAQQLYEAIDGAPTVRAFRLADRHVSRVADRSLAAVDLSLAAVRLRTRLFGRLNLAELAGMTAILAAGFLLVRSHTVTVGAATAAALYFHRLFDPINALLALADDAQAAGAAAARLVGIAQLPPVSEPASARRPADASIAARGIRHAYRPGHEVLHGIDLYVPPGGHLALIGRSGAGKTTLAKLIAGIHRPTSGEILIGRLGHADLDPAATRRTVTLLTQETHVFAGTLADDLRLARPGAGDGELEAALARVGADWVAALPDGIDTRIGDGGHRLTSTQAQQLALARLALADPPIAILDEATADAGSAGARILDRAAENVLRDRTALIVAHRLSQARRADRIAVLEDGALAEHGSHDALLEQGGAYSRLWEAWNSAG